MFDPSHTLQWQKDRGRESEEGLSVSEEVTFDATNDPSVSELEDLRVEDADGVGTSETALDTIPGGCSSQCGVQPNDKYTEIIEYEKLILPILLVGTISMV